MGLVGWSGYVYRADGGAGRVGVGVGVGVYRLWYSVVWCSGFLEGIFETLGFGGGEYV